MQPQQYPSGPAAIVIADTGTGDSHASGVSWAAVFAGATAAAALSLILLMLGLGLGLSSISPWSYSVSAIGTTTIVWIVFMQLISSGVGGYLAGRLRIRWANVHTDEVYFRDTAHGLLSWAVASLLTVALLAGGARAILSDAIEAGTSAAPAIAGAVNSVKSSGDSIGNPLDYFSDMLLRSDQPASDASTSAIHNEVNRIFVSNMRTVSFSTQDREYLTRLIAKRSGISQRDAEARIDAVYARLNKATSDAKESAKEAAESARKAAAHSALWMFVALLCGAFIASLAATVGGRQRDRVVGASGHIIR